MNQRGFVLPSPLMAVSIVAGVLLLGNIMWFRLYQGARDDLITYRANVEAAQATIAAENARRVAEARKETADVANHYASVVGRLDGEYRSRLGGLRRQASNCATLPLVRESAALPDGAAEEPVSGSTAFETECFAVERRAAHDAGQLIFLQDWVKRVCK